MKIYSNKTAGIVASLLVSALMLSVSDSVYAKKPAKIKNESVMDNMIMPKINKKKTSLNPRLLVDNLIDNEIIFAEYIKNRHGRLTMIPLGKNASFRSIGADAVVFRGFIVALGNQESSNDYNEINWRTGATGKYQIMPENWPVWAKQAGLTSDAKMTPENQETVAKYKLWQYYLDYGLDGACVAWYAGERNAKRWVDGENCGIGIHGEFSWDKPQGYGNEPSVSQYVREVVAKTYRALSR